MRVEASTDLQAPAPAVWDVVTDPDALPRFMAGPTRWEAVGQSGRGLGARYRVRMLVGSAQLGGEIEVVEFDQPRDMAWTSVTGVDHRGRWRLRQQGPDRTRVTLRISYSAPGGLLSVVADRLAAPMVRANLRRSLVQLAPLVEKRNF